MKKILAAAIGAGALVALGAAPAQAAESPAQLSVLHGVPGLTVREVPAMLVSSEIEP